MCGQPTLPPPLQPPYQAAGPLRPQQRGLMQRQAAAAGPTLEGTSQEDSGGPASPGNSAKNSPRLIPEPALTFRAWGQPAINHVGEGEGPGLCVCVCVCVMPIHTEILGNVHQP